MVIIKPIIGITLRCIKNDISQDILKVSKSIIEKVEENGGIPILIPDDKTTDNLDYFLKLCDGFIIPGGSTWHLVDEVIIKYACINDLPVLGICAGMQALGNIEHFCGSEKSDKTVKVGSSSHNDPTKMFVHEININNGLLYDILGNDKIMVNSRHNDMVVKSNKFTIEATSDDGVIEAISIPNKKFILGVQWHPEDLDDSNSQKIFAYFISKAKNK